MEKNSENSYILTIRFNSDGFSLSVSDNFNALLSVMNIPINWSSISLEELILSLKNETQINYKSIRIIYESDNYTFIPVDLFKIEEAIYFLSLEHTLSNTDSVLFNKILYHEIVNIFTVPGIIHNAINQSFPEIQIEHHLSWILTDKILRKTETCIYCLLRTKMLDVIVVENSKIQLINSFTGDTAEDFVYFTLSVIEKLSIESANSIAILLNKDKKPEFGNLLEKYIAVTTQY